MALKNIILDSLKQSFLAVWRNKMLFALLFVLQLIFFAVFSFMTLPYMTKMLESAKEINDYLSVQSLDEVSLGSSILQQKSILGDDPLLISRNFNEIVKNFRIYLAYAFVLLTVFLSISWSITHKLVHKISMKRIMGCLFRVIIILSVYLGLIFLFLFSLLNISFMEFSSNKLLAKLILFLFFSIALAYFMLISLALSNHAQFKKIGKKTLRIGIRKIHYVLLAYLINACLLSVSIILLFYFIEKSQLILLLSIIMIIFSFVFGRIFLMNVVEKLYPAE